MDKPPVTLIGTLPPVKGLSPYCQELLKCLSKRIEIEFIGFKRLYPDFLYPGGTKITDENYKIPEMLNANIRNILTFYNPFSWLWAGLTARGSVIHAQWWSHVLAPVYLVILLICKVKRKKIVITVHNVFPHENSWLARFLNGIVISLGDAFIVHTSKNQETISHFYNIPENKISVIPHGILEPVSIKGVSREEARKYLGIQNDSKVILHFGNIRDYKGLDVLLQALPLVVKELNGVTLIIAGKPWVDFQVYDKIIDDNNLGSYIIKKLDFIPPSEVEYYFVAANVVVLPYKYFDSQSGVGALALPYSKPLIVTNVGGLPDFIKDERAIAVPNDPEDLANKLTCILSDEDLMAKLCQDSEYIAKQYGWDEIADKTIETYSEVLKSSRY